MDKNDFFIKLKEESNNLGYLLNDKQIEQFYEYMNLLLEWNEKINLTAITEPEEIITKHFIDSITALKHLENKTNIIDVGTGAGFPGIPLKISKPELELTLVDSLNKRINFLDEVKKVLNIENINTIHARAEEIGNNKNYRERYDAAVSRAVARLNVLVEYLLPAVRIGGSCICMKGPDANEEIEEAKNAIEILGGKIEKIEEFNLPNSEIKRTIIIINKVKKTPNDYPRKSGIPSKKPIK